MNRKELEKNCRLRGMDVFFAATREEARQHILEQVQNTTVGIGGSKTIEALGLYDELLKNNEVHWHWKDGASPEVFRAAEQAEVYLSSANGIAETGEIVNIDGRGNRLAALTYAEGKRLFIIAGVNKIRPDLASAIERSRKIAAPLNIPKIPGVRPCNTTFQCFDCRSRDRGCCVMQIIMFKPMGCKNLEVVIIDEELGF